MQAFCVANRYLCRLMKAPLPHLLALCAQYLGGEHALAANASHIIGLRWALLDANTKAALSDALFASQQPLLRTYWRVLPLPMFVRLRKCVTEWCETLSAYQSWAHQPTAWLSPEQQISGNILQYSPEKQQLSLDNITTWHFAFVAHVFELEKNRILAVGYQAQPDGTLRQCHFHVQQLLYV